MIFQKVIPDFYVLNATMINKIIHHADCNLIVTQERYFAQIIAKVLEGLPHQK